MKLDEIYKWGTRFLEEKLEWGELATFTPNKSEPVYNWFYYKEGFAKEIIYKMADLFNLQENSWVLDPFCGSGTTLLACKQLGINSMGTDVMPISVFASNVKTQEYDAEILRKTSKELMFHRFMKPEITTIFAPMKRLFSPYALQDIVFFKGHVMKIEDEKVRNFILLALIKASMRVSWAWKDGAVIKVRKQNSSRVPLRKMYKNVLNGMIKDVQKFQSKSCNIMVKQGDAREIESDENKFDAIMTSPPYLNNIDYTKVYAIENWFVKDILFQEPPLRTHIGLDKKVEFLEELNLPEAARAYFFDMNESMKEMYRVCKNGANVGMIVGNGFVEGMVIDSDIILGHLAEKIGFKLEKIIVMNKRAALVNRTQKVGTLRESLVWLKK